MDSPSQPPATRERTAGFVGAILRRCARVTSGAPIIAEIDGLRFVAIVAVALYHLNGYVLAKDPQGATPTDVTRLLSYGHFGVQFFFLISGFVLLLPFAAWRIENASRPRLGRYYLRRLTRLEPPYFINLVLIALLLFGSGKLSSAEIVRHLAASAAYVHNAVYHEGSAINPVAWSLEVEVQFYILAPAIALLFAIPHRLTRIAAMVSVGIASAAFFQREPTGAPNELNLLGALQYFLLGAILVDLFVVSWRRLPPRGLAWDVVVVVVWSIVGGFPVLHTPTLLRVTLPVAVMMTAIGGFRGRVLNAVVRNRWIVTIGGMCYTIYLYHSFIISLVGRATLPQVAAYAQQFGTTTVVLIEALIVLPVVLVTSALFFVFAEKPFMYRDWPQRARAALRRPSAPAAAKLA